MTWKTATIGKKITAGFAVVLTALCVMAAWSYLGVGSIVRNADQVIQGNRLDGALAQREVDHLNWSRHLSELLFNDEVDTLSVETDHTRCAFGKWLYSDQRREIERVVPSLAALLKQIEAPHERLHASAADIGERYHRVDHRLGWFLREKKSDHHLWMHRIKDALLDPAAVETGAETDPHQCTIGRWLYADETEALKRSDPEFAELWQALEAPHRRLHESVAAIDRALAGGARDEAQARFLSSTQSLAEETTDALDAVRDWHDGLIESREDTEAVYAYETMPALEEVQKLLRAIRDEARRNGVSDETLLSAAADTRTSVMVIGAAAVAAGLLLAWAISRSVLAALRSVSADIDTGAEQVASAAGQVSASSQSLAEGASEQAASLEEATAALEQLSSTTRQNADSADQADRMMTSATSVIQKANQAMDEMTESMEAITTASEETFKIIKTLDEIAFQTNLLALNAAVEAARAGAAGAGFAVVADEVRSLALRAAEAARSTSALIDGTVTRVKAGVQIVTRTNAAFAQVQASTETVSGLVSEISSTSREQATGIAQINATVTQMDRVTQQNAAGAEESASSAEEMNAQAAQLAGAAERLSVLIHGRKRRRGGRVPAAAPADGAPAPPAGVPEALV